MSGTKITVQRPSGEIEIVMQEGRFLTEALRRKMIAATRSAGRGEIIGFEEIVSPPTPEDQQLNLRAERRNLVSDIQAAIEEQDEAFECAHSREDARAWVIKRSHDPKIEAARAALAAFDASHPEVAEAIRTEKQAAAARHMWD